jgi:hypothetical protein
MLTKSLHTITSATRVAEYVFSVRGGRPYTPALLASDALMILGYDYTAAGILAAVDTGDATVARIVANCGKILAASARRAA